RRDHADACACGCHRSFQKLPTNHAPAILPLRIASPGEPWQFGATASLVIFLMTSGHQFHCQGASPMPSHSEMLVVCPHCGRESNDVEFCDSCNREIRNSAEQCDLAPRTVTLGNGDLLDCSCWSENWPNDPAAYF